MHRSHRYSCSHNTSHQFGDPLCHGTSSGFSAGANPNEDWRKITNISERRRIQNRLAQRNYRNRLKKRLEELERRVASTSGSTSPEQTHEQLENRAASASGSTSPVQTDDELEQPNSDGSDKSQSRWPNPSSSSASESERNIPTEPLSNDYTPPHDEHRAIFGHKNARQLSVSPPPVFSYASYSFPEHCIHTPYPQHTACHAIPALCAGLPMQSQYLAPFPSVLPGMMPSGAAMKRDILSPFSLSYASMAAIDIPTAQPYQDSNTHVNQPYSNSIPLILYLFPTWDSLFIQRQKADRESTRSHPFHTPAGLSIHGPLLRQSQRHFPQPHLLQFLGHHS